MKHIEQLLEFLTRMNRSVSASTNSCEVLLESRSSSPFEERFGSNSISSESQDESSIQDSSRPSMLSILDADDKKVPFLQKTKQINVIDAE
jgi:hypothetical protein